MYILWLASMTVNNNTDTAQNKNIALFAVFVVAAAATIIILLLLSHRIDCIPLSTDVPCVCLSDLLYASTINYGWFSFRWNPFPKEKKFSFISFQSIQWQWQNRITKSNAKKNTIQSKLYAKYEPTNGK